MEQLWTDLRYGVRCLRKSLGFTVVSVLTLALGIGANSAIFSIIDSEMLRPLPYESPSRLVSLTQGSDDVSITATDFLEWRTQAESFDGIAAVTTPEQTILTGGGAPDQVSAARTSAEFFRVLGRRAVIGHTFGPNDPQGVVLSNGYWRRHFAANPAVIGEGIELNGKPFTIVGVMPRDFYFEESDLWEPLTFSGAESVQSQDPVLRVIARLKSGVTLHQADAETRVLGMRLRSRLKEPVSRATATLIPLTRPEFNKRGYVFALLGAVNFTLLIACSNVASMFLARGVARQREFAIRAALGAGRGRLMVQTITESMIVAISGGTLGLGLASGILRTINSLAPSDPFATNITGGSLNFHVLAFTLSLSMLTGFLIGPIPVWTAWRFDLMQALNDGGSGPGGGVRKLRIRGVLVVFEIALSLTLLIGAALMIESLHHLAMVPTGLNTSNVLTVRMPLIGYRYPEATQTVAFYNDILQRVQTIPSVKYAAITNNFPLSDASVSLSMYAPGTGERKIVVDLQDVTPGYFLAMGIPLLRGRFFSSTDNIKSEQVAIINQTMARHYWPGRDPIGQMIVGKWLIVGIAGDTVQSSLSSAPVPAVYRPYAQQPFASNIATLIVRAYGDPLLLGSALRSTIWSIESNEPLIQIRTMDEVLADSIWQPRLSASVFSLLAFLALFISMVGLYGVISYSVSQRTREMGIRLALGAHPIAVRRLIMSEALLLALWGTLIGGVAGLAITRFLRNVLFGIGPFDPLAFGGAVTALLVVALLACYVPASRAMSVDPLVALRHE